MQQLPFDIRGSKGSAFVTVICVLSISAALATIALSYSLFTMRSSYRSITISSAQTIAEGELEAMYYKWKTALLNDLVRQRVAAAFDHDSADVNNRFWDDLSEYPSINPPNEPVTEVDSLLPTQVNVAGRRWRVKRSVKYEREDIGLVPGAVPKDGRISYYSARVEVISPDTPPILARVGRMFAVSEASIYQFSILYQNDLEINPAQNMQIAGQVVCNSRIYAGGFGGAVVEFLDRVHYAQLFNGRDAITTDADLSFQPTLNVTSLTVTDPTFDLGRLVALNKMGRTENFVGGVDAATAVDNYPAAYSGPNAVYRTLIDPEPAVAEDPTLRERRMYNRARRGGLIVRTAPGNVTVNYTTKQADGTYVNTDFSAYFAAAFSQETMTDPREFHNDPIRGPKNITTIDMGLFDPLLRAFTQADTFNGLVYINETQPNTSAIRLRNGSRIPGLVNSNGEVGLTIVTNAGLYIQGDYNSVAKTGLGNVDLAGNGQDAVPAAIMADAVTLLSAGWIDENGATVALTPDRLATSDITICAAIITGNVATTSNTVSSGGVQNLVRLVEWWNGYQTKLFGVMAQMHRSVYFIAPWPNNNLHSTAPTEVYENPSTRTIQYNSSLRTNPPNLNPTITNFTRGSFFFWRPQQ
jgi:hypothetical protein